MGGTFKASCQGGLRVTCAWPSSVRPSGCVPESPFPRGAALDGAQFRSGPQHRAAFPTVCRGTLGSPERPTDVQEEFGVQG